MFFKCIYTTCVIIPVLITVVHGWDTEQLEIFDLVEEINQNFYNYLNISQDADLQSIKRAFRGQSLILHPDKNDAPDAEVSFRNLVSIYEVLRDPEKRAHYDDVLKNGLPNWKSAVYYYRHVRKMGLAETLATLFVVITIGQYLVAWGAYVEKKYTAEQVYGAKLKKQQRKQRGGGAAAATIVPNIDEIFDIRKPSIRDTLPLQIPRAAWFCIVSAPTCFRWLNEYRKTYRKPEETSEDEEDEQPESRVRIRPVRKRKPGFVPMERDDSELPPRLIHIQQNEAGVPTPVVITGGLWTDDDLAELVQLVKKYPGGTTDRWEKIAETMSRTISEVTYMANKLKENFYRLPGQDDDESKSAADCDLPKKQKTRGGKINGTESFAGSAWSQLQQKALEAALQKFSKGPADRWEKIAKCVPEKTKEECILRYKYLVEKVKKQKEGNYNDNETTEDQ